MGINICSKFLFKGHWGKTSKYPKSIRQFNMTYIMSMANPMEAPPMEVFLTTLSNGLYMAYKPIILLCLVYIN